MKHPDPLEDTICRILKECRRIAVVGISDKPWRDSNRIARYLLSQGYEILPVNPKVTEVLGLPSYPDLLSVPGPIDVVDIFRRPEHIPEIVDQAVKAGASVIWMQSGLADTDAAERARRHGLRVVMDRCIMVEHGHHSGCWRDQGLNHELHED